MEVFCKKYILKKSRKICRKTLLPESGLLNKVAGLRPVNFAKFVRTPFLQNTFGRLSQLLIPSNVVRVIG